MRLEYPDERGKDTKVPEPVQKNNPLSGRPRKPGRPSKPLGSRTVTMKGAVLVKIGHNTWVYEHRLVMEKHIGRKLNEDEDVRHLNDDQTDNRIENLYIVASSGKVTCADCGKVLHKHG